MLLARELTERIIGLAIEVHRLTGPGMLESVYEGCLCHELQQAEIAFQRQAGIPVTYKGVQFDEGFRAAAASFSCSKLSPRRNCSSGNCGSTSAAAANFSAASAKSFCAAAATPAAYN